MEEESLGQRLSESVSEIIWRAVEDAKKTAGDDSSMQAAVLEIAFISFANAVSEEFPDFKWKYAEMIELELSSLRNPKS